MRASAAHTLIGTWCVRCAHRFAGFKKTAVQGKQRTDGEVGLFVCGRDETIKKNQPDQPTDPAWAALYHHHHLQEVVASHTIWCRSLVSKGTHWSTLPIPECVAVRCRSYLHWSSQTIVIKWTQYRSATATSPRKGITTRVEEIREAYVRFGVVCALSKWPKDFEQYNNKKCDFILNLDWKSTRTLCCLQPPGLGTCIITVPCFSSASRSAARFLAIVNAKWYASRSDKKFRPNTRHT